MDDLAHSWQPLNQRKRKAECSSDVKPKEPESKDPSSSQSEIPSPSAAPRQPWLTQSCSEWQAAAAAAAAGSSSGATSPLATEVLLNPAPSASAKRPRLEKIQTSLRPPRKPHTKRSPTKSAFLRPPRQGSDIEDLGVVSSADPGPSTGSLLELRTPKSPASFTPLSPTSANSLPIDVNSIYVPSLQPLINRQTLSELDLDVILRNPQLRHDLLFDPGLQFRPTCSRRKRIMSEKYWNAIIREVESGCTCVSFDARGKLQRTVCACSHIPQPPSSPVAAYSAPMNIITLRMPSRIRDLLSEFLEVLLLVIQPLSKVSGMYVNPNTFQSQMQEHEAQAEYIRSMFDPALIEQELKHEVFDPSGLFAVIGTTLKGHCAPMRDAAVESMMKAAQACAPGGSGTKRDAVMALKMCMELLELMKLDIANHQLQTLRPFLLRTSGQFEYKAFKNRRDCDSSLDATREWLRKAHEELLKHEFIPQSPNYSTLSRNQQTYLSVLRGLVDLVFESQPLLSPSSPTTPEVTPSDETTSAKPRIFGRPETLYLDHARLSHLHTDSNDALAMQLYLLLYRQLSHSPSSSRQVQPTDLAKIKAEIRDIALGRLAYCIDRDQPPSPTSSRSHAERLNAEKENKRDILLQIARRSQEARQPRIHTPTEPCSRSISVPDESLVNLAQRWTDSNMRLNSPLATLSQRRLRDAVFHYVVAMVYTNRNSTTNPITLESLTSSTHAKGTAAKLPPGLITPDLEPLADEVCSLGEKISRLALIHLDTYLPLYEQADFLD